MGRDRDESRFADGEDYWRVLGPRQYERSLGCNPGDGDDHPTVADAYHACFKADPNPRVVAAIKRGCMPLYDISYYGYKRKGTPGCWGSSF